MKNNKGITLVELIISMALISIIVVFLFRLLVDVKYYDNTRNYDRSNAQKRAIIISRVEKDFLERGLSGLTDRSSSSNIVIDFTYLDGTNATLTFSKDSGGYFVNYKNSSEEEKWYVDMDNESTKLNFNCVNYSFITAPDSNEYFVIRFSIPVVALNGSPNIIDDFEFSYVGKKNTVNLNNFPRKSNLGTYQANSCS